MRVCGLVRNFEYWKGKQRTTCRKTAPGRELLGTLRLLNRRRPWALYLYTLGVSLCARVCACVCGVVVGVCNSLRNFEYRKKDNGGSESDCAPSGAWAHRGSQGLVF